MVNTELILQCKMVLRYINPISNKPDKGGMNVYLDQIAVVCGASLQAILYLKLQSLCTD